MINNWRKGTMTSIENIRLKVSELKLETGSNIHISTDENRKAILETTYEVLAGLEEALGSYAQR